MKVRGSLLTGEVIQIGAVKLDNNFDVCDSFSINIEPVFYKKMNSNVKRITGITEGALRDVCTLKAHSENFWNSAAVSFAL